MYVFENMPAFHHVWFIKAMYVLASGLLSTSDQLLTVSPFNISNQYLKPGGNFPLDPVIG